MNRREIIIIFIAAAIGVYGLLDYLLFSKSKTSDQSAMIKVATAKTNDFAMIAQARLKVLEKVSQDSNLSYWMVKAESAWTNDPFLDETLNQDQVSINQAKDARDIPKIHYSGFIRAGKNLMAVINGMEYMVGETIKEAGYKVFSITPTHIKLLTDANKEIILSIKEN